MCKRCITPSYDSLFAQKLESHVTHVLVSSLQLQEITLRNCAFCILAKYNKQLRHCLNLIIKFI